MSKVHVARVVTVVACLVVLGSAFVRAADRPDAWITMTTKVSLMTTDGVSTKDLNVDTVNGVVTLHGKVATEAERAKAGAGRRQSRWRQGCEEHAAGRAGSAPRHGRAR